MQIAREGIRNTAAPPAAMVPWASLLKEGIISSVNGARGPGVSYLELSLLQEKEAEGIYCALHLKTCGAFAAWVTSIMKSNSKIDIEWSEREKDGMVYDYFEVKKLEFAPGELLRTREMTQGLMKQMERSESFEKLLLRWHPSLAHTLPAKSENMHSFRNVIGAVDGKLALRNI